MIAVIREKTMGYIGSVAESLRRCIKNSGIVHIILTMVSTKYTKLILTNNTISFRSLRQKKDITLNYTNKEIETIYEAVAISDYEPDKASGDMCLSFSYDRLIHIFPYDTVNSLELFYIPIAILERNRLLVLLATYTAKHFVVDMITISTEKYLDLVHNLNITEPQYTLRGEPIPTQKANILTSNTALPNSIEYLSVFGVTPKLSYAITRYDTEGNLVDIKTPDTPYIVIDLSNVQTLHFVQVQKSPKSIYILQNIDGLKATNIKLDEYTFLQSQEVNHIIDLRGKKNFSQIIQNIQDRAKYRYLLEVSDLASYKASSDMIEAIEQYNLVFIITKGDTTLEQCIEQDSMLIIYPSSFDMIYVGTIGTLDSCQGLIEGDNEERLVEYTRSERVYQLQHRLRVEFPEVKQDNLAVQYKELAKNNKVLLLKVADKRYLSTSTIPEHLILDGTQLTVKNEATLLTVELDLTDDLGYEYPILGLRSQNAQQYIRKEYEIVELDFDKYIVLPTKLFLNTIVSDERGISVVPLFINKGTASIQCLLAHPTSGLVLLTIPLRLFNELEYNNKEIQTDLYGTHFQELSTIEVQETRQDNSKVQYQDNYLKSLCLFGTETEKPLLATQGKVTTDTYGNLCSIQLPSTSNSLSYLDISNVSRANYCLGIPKATALSLQTQPICTGIQNTTEETQLSLLRSLSHSLCLDIRGTQTFPTCEVYMRKYQDFPSIIRLLISRQQLSTSKPYNLKQVLNTYIETAQQNDFDLEMYLYVTDEDMTPVEHIIAIGTTFVVLLLGDEPLQGYKYELAPGLKEVASYAGMNLIV